MVKQKKCMIGLNNWVLMTEVKNYINLSVLVMDNIW